jgi:glycosyltransferase involved in cell wall biosynthesis
MTDLIIVPLEPLVERYTGAWYEHIPTEFRRVNFNVKVIDGVTLASEVVVGTFLDINSTANYKFSQLMVISKMFHNKEIKDGTVFFFSDIEFWGLESVRLLAQMNGIKVFLTGFLHAASYTKEDAFAIAAPYQQYTELGWLAALDLIFVGSLYHKKQVLNLRILPLAQSEREVVSMGNKIRVTKNPIFLQDYPALDTGNKKKKVLLTNRFDIEKRPNETLELFFRLKIEFPEWEFVVTTSRSSFKGNNQLIIKEALQLENEGVITIKAGLTKLQYYQELAESAIMVTHSIEENYGYCIAESLIYGCAPLMRKGLSHSEFTDTDALLFDSSGAAPYIVADPGSDYVKLRTLMATFGTPAFPKIPFLDTSGMANIIKEIQNLTGT